MNQRHLIANICQYTNSQDLLAFSWAFIQLGHAHLILPLFDQNKMIKLLHESSDEGAWQFELLKYIQHHENAVYRLTVEDAKAYNNAFRSACECGNLNVCQWLHKTFKLTVKDAKGEKNLALRLACSNGYIEICQWLYQTFNLTVKDARSFSNYALRYACLDGHIEVCQWLHQTFKLTVEDARTDYNDALKRACENGQLGARGVSMVASNF